MGSPQRIAYLKFTARVRMFFGTINLLIDNFPEFLNSNSPANTLPWDGVPGGTQGLRSNLPNNLPVQTGPLNMFIILNDLGVSGTLSGNNFLADNFCFVPIVSALDITTINSASLTAPYVAGVSPSNPSRSTNFIAQESPSAANNNLPNNLDHPRFTERNARWLYNEMESVANNNLNCSPDCQPQSFSINGSNNLCTSGQYRFNQLPPHGSITWSVSNPSAVSLSSTTTNPVTLTRNGSFNGLVTLTGTAVICGQTYTSSLQIFGGPPDTYAYYNSPYGSSDLALWSNFGNTVYNPACINTIINVTPFIPLGAFATWTVTPNGSGITWEQVGNNLRFSFIQTGQTLTATVTVQNECDSKVLTYLFEGVNGVGNCGSGQQLRVNSSPNPASNQVNINVDVQAMQQMGINNPAWLQIKNIKLFSNSGILRKEFNYPNGTQNVNINVNDLSNGLYRLQITNGIQTVNRMILIQR